MSRKKKVKGSSYTLILKDDFIEILGFPKPVRLPLLSIQYDLINSNTIKVFLLVFWEYLPIFYVIIIRGHV